MRGRDLLHLDAAVISDVEQAIQFGFPLFPEGHGLGAARVPNPGSGAQHLRSMDVPQASDVDFAALRRDLEAAGVHEYQVETQRAETVRRRAVAVSSQMALEEAIKAYLEQRPELQPMADALIAEARVVEQAVVGGAA